MISPASPDSASAPVKRISSSFQGNGRPSGGRPNSQVTDERHAQWRDNDKSAQADDSATFPLRYLTAAAAAATKN